MTALGYQNLTLDVLTRLCNHGISSGFIQELKDLGYARPDIEDNIVALRNHGITQQRIRNANASAGSQLSIEKLTPLAASGRMP